MSKIIRTPTFAGGGITHDEKTQLNAYAKKWIANALSTEPVEPGRLVPAIESLYAAAGLKRPRVVIVDSPRTMAFAGGFAAAIWWLRKKPTISATNSATESATLSATRSATISATLSATESATDSATDSATESATLSATDSATDSATESATLSATESATRSATDSATRSATLSATRSATEMRQLAAYFALENGGSIDFFLGCAKNWWRMYQGGNMWSAWPCYLSASRDILNLCLPEHDKYKAWEACAIEGGFRVVHEEFCIVSDRPKTLKVDAENRAHCEDGPSHEWRDGWKLYHWHGVSIPGEWIEDKKSLSAKTALTWGNIEQRRAACEIVGWAKILKELNAKVIDKDGDPEIGSLLEVDLPGSGKERFLYVLCGTGREFALPVPRDCGNTALEANAWTYGLDAKSFMPEVRT